MRAALAAITMTASACAHAGDPAASVAKARELVAASELKLSPCERSIVMTADPQVAMYRMAGDFAQYMFSWHVDDVRIAVSGQGDRYALDGAHVSRTRRRSAEGYGDAGMTHSCVHEAAEADWSGCEGSGHSCDVYPREPDRGFFAAPASTAREDAGGGVAWVLQGQLLPAGKTTPWYELRTSPDATSFFAPAAEILSYQELAPVVACWPVKSVSGEQGDYGFRVEFKTDGTGIYGDVTQEAAMPVRVYWKDGVFDVRFMGDPALVPDDGRAFIGWIRRSGHVLLRGADFDPVERFPDDQMRGCKGPVTRPARAPSGENG